MAAAFAGVDPRPAESLARELKVTGCPDCPTQKRTSPKYQRSSAQRLRCAEHGPTGSRDIRLRPLWQSAQSGLLWRFGSPGAFHWRPPPAGFDYQSGFAPDPDPGHRDGLASGVLSTQLPPDCAVGHQQLRGTNKVLKKKAAVAVARRLLVDIWKMRTGRTTA